MHALDRVDEAESLGAQTLRQWPEPQDSKDKESIGEIALVLGKIRLARNENSMLLRAQAMAWWRVTHHDRLLWLIRELRPVRSPDAQYFHLVVNGRIAPDSPLAEAGTGYLTWIDVVADTPAEALGLSMELDPPEAGVELEIEEAKIGEARPNDVKGIYAARSGRIFYRGE